MSRIREKFDQLKEQGRKGFVPFVTAGDPSMQASKEIVLTLARSGADIIELGVPFSDPMADGPTIQASSMRALENGATLPGILKMVEEIRTVSDVPIVLFSYLNPLYRYGLEKLADDAAGAGVDGVLVTDLVDDEARDAAEMFSRRGIDMIPLIAPTTSDERLESICAAASGFIYAVSRAGVTGTRSETDSAAEKLVRRARRFTETPIAVGFGISTRRQIVEVWEYADAAVVGSAIVAEIERSAESGNVLESVERLVRDLIPPAFAKDAAEI